MAVGKVSAVSFVLIVETPACAVSTPEILNVNEPTKTLPPRESVVPVSVVVPNCPRAVPMPPVVSVPAVPPFKVTVAAVEPLSIKETTLMAAPAGVPPAFVVSTEKFAPFERLIAVPAKKLTAPPDVVTVTVEPEEAVSRNVEAAFTVYDCSPVVL